MCAPETKIKSCREVFTQFFVINNRIYIVFSQRKKVTFGGFPGGKGITLKNVHGKVPPHNIDSPLKKKQSVQSYFHGFVFCIKQYRYCPERYSPEINTCRVVLHGNVSLLNAVYEGLFSVNVLGAVKF